MVAQKPVRMRSLPFSTSFLLPITLLSLLVNLVNAGYNVGVGRADITGPAAEVFFSEKEVSLVRCSHILVVSSHM